MTYHYEACNRAGQHYQGKIEAVSRQEAARQIRRQGLWVIKLSTPQVSSSSHFIGSLADDLFTPSCSRGQQALFFRQLAVLTAAGIPLHDALKNLAHTGQRRRLSMIISHLHQAVLQGSSFSGALQKHARFLPPQVVRLVQAGEASGTLETVLFRLADYLEKTAIAQEKLKSVLLYPAILAVSAIGALVFMTLVILPTFASLLNSLSAELPLPTRILLSAADFLSSYGWETLLGSGLGLAGLAAISQLPAVKLRYTHYLLMVPLLGQLRLHTAWMLALSTLATLMEQGIALPAALALASQSLNNAYLEQQLHKVQEKITQGSSLQSAIAGCPFFPSLLQDMISAGEQSGQLESMLTKGADFCRVMVENEAARLQALAEPAAILTVGGLIFFFVLSVIMPLLNTMDALTM